jgi:tight adherence protein B
VTADRWVLAAAIPVLGIALVGVWQLIQVRLDRAEIARRSELDRVEYQASLLRSRLDAALRRTSLGSWLDLQVSRSGIDRSALDLALTYVGASIGLALVVAMLAPDWLAVVGALLGIWAVRRWLERRRQARLEEFVAQLPELARTLSNATSAGRSLHSALQLAADDLADPAGAELKLLSEQLRIGQPVDEALEVLQERLPSKELGVLASTLVIQQRTGGDVVTALRDMADTLEARKELRREVKTLIAGAVQTGYVTGGLGVGIVLVVNLMQPGMIDGMLRRPLGQLSMIVAISLYVIAFSLVRRMTQIDV